MSNPVFTDPNNAILKDRLARISAQLRNLQLSTADEYQAEVYSAINAVLSLGLAMTPLAPVASQGPAVVGDAANNYQILNNDAADIAAEVLRIEDEAASLFNLAATSQNQLRQMIRELVFAPNQKRYLEDFLNSNRLVNVTGSIDFNAGLATASLVNETTLSPTFSSGATSVGSLDSSSAFANLTDGRSDTVMQWNGASLELVLTFPGPQIVNRITLNTDDYAGMEIDTFTTSPDGTLVEDVLEDLDVDRILLDGTSSKFSGDVIIDFPPRHTQTARIILKDRTGRNVIALREFVTLSRTYSSTGQLTSSPITAPTGSVLFSTIQNVFTPYTSITHQISFNGTQFVAIAPGTVIALASSPFYYRAILERSTSMFDTVQGPLVQSPLDPIGAVNYTLTSTVTSPLGNGIIERTLTLNDVTGSVVLRESPLPGTLQIQEGSVILSLVAGDYSFANNTITFPSGVTGIVISYQTTSLGPAAVKDREQYYTPLLYEVRFEQQ